MDDRSRFTLTSGRSVRITNIDQSLTYSGLLEGYPSAEINESIVDSARIEAQKRLQYNPLVIPPVETRIADKQTRKISCGTPASIPGVTCIALLHSLQIARDESMFGSMLPIVWFESEFALPIDEEIQKQIRSIKWEKHASDYDF